MLLKNISNEFAEVANTLRGLGAHNCKILNVAYMENTEFSMPLMLEFIPDTRKFIEHHNVLKSRKFKSNTVNEYIIRYLNCIDQFTICLDDTLQALAENRKEHNVNYSIGRLKAASNEISNILKRIEVAGEIMEMAVMETWEPLPEAIENKSVEDVIILSETQGASLSDISKDVSSIDNFLNTIRHLIKGITSDNFYLRRVETGSLEIAISCILGAVQIVEFIFLYIKLCQQAEKRELKNKERKLDLINKSLDSAKRILEIEPHNTEVNEIIQKCALSIIEFLESNPKGSINGEKYDIEMENLKIEEKTQEK